MDFGAISHLASIKGSVPFLHFFDGFRTSHEIQKIDVLGYDQLAELVDKEALERYRNRALHPEHPVQRTMVNLRNIFPEQGGRQRILYQITRDS